MHNRYTRTHRRTPAPPAWPSRQRPGIQGGGAGRPPPRPASPMMTHSDATLPSYVHTSVAQRPSESRDPARRRGAGHPPKMPFCTTFEATPTRKQSDAQSHAEATGRGPVGRQSTFFGPFSFITPRKIASRNHPKVNNQADQVPTIRRAATAEAPLLVANGP